MRHRDPLVAKPLQQRVVWKCEVVLKIVVDLLVLSVQTHACMQLRAHAHAHARSCPCKIEESRETMPCSLAPKCSNACASARMRRCYMLCGGLVMLTGNELEVVSLPVFAIVLQALLSPCASTLAVSPVRFGHPLHFPIHEKTRMDRETQIGGLGLGSRTRRRAELTYIDASMWGLCF